MKINIHGILENDYLKDKYSKHAGPEYRIDNVPYINFPFSLEEVNSKYKYVSWYFIDYDSNPVVAFSWMHWLIANYKTTDFKIPENLIKSNKDYIGGVNSYASPLAKITDTQVTHNYGGPGAPDKDHYYTLVVYAHENPLNLKQGFYFNEFLEEINSQEHQKNKIRILAKC